MFDIAGGRKGGSARHGGIYSSSDYMRVDNVTDPRSFGADRKDEGLFCACIDRIVHAKRI